MQLVGHPHLYQKFVGHPRYVFGIYVTNILMSCGRCIAVKVGQMPIHSVLVLIHAIGRTSTLVSEICWTPTLCIGNLCYQYINELWPMYSCESGADADPCNWSDIHTCIRNLLDIHAMYCESHYYGINIVISCGRCMAVKVGQMPIHSVQVPIHASGIGQTSTLVSEICCTSTLCIGNHTTMLP